MKRFGAWAVCLGVVCGSLPSYALEEVFFGPEFTFMELNFELMVNARKVYQRMINHLVDGQPEGAKFIYKGDLDVARGTFYSPNGWSFTHHEEEKVIEVVTSIGTPEYFQKYGSDMQDAIFVSAGNEGFFPAMFRGGGHINVSTKSFLSNPLLFRNFIVDMMNHNELFMGVFGYDTNNAIPVQMLPESHLQGVLEVIERFDNGEYPNEMDLIQFAMHIQNALNATIAEPFWVAWHSDATAGRDKYHAVNFSHFIGAETCRLEIRGVRPQASMDVWNRQIRLIRDRIKYLETIKKPIPYEARVPVEPITWEKHQLNPPVKAKQALREFYNYVRQSGHSWIDHRDYLWPKWVIDGELEKFEKSDWFLKREQNIKQIMGPGKLGCEKELARAK